MLPCRDLSARQRTGGGYRGGQASIRIGGDVPDWDNTESRERDEDAAWRDLVARFDAALTEQQPVPWPAREDMPAEPLPEADGADGPDGAPGADGRHRGPEADALDAEPGRHAADGEHGRHAADGEHGRHAAGPERGPHEPNGKHAPDGHGPDGQGPEKQGPDRHGGRGRGAANAGARGWRVPAPPAPPPLPKLDPMAKGAWVALFGGPGYLMVATAAGWSVSGLAAFCAVAAFVAGFVILVLHMHDPG